MSIERPVWRIVSIKQSTGVADGLSKGKQYYLKVRNPGKFNDAGRGMRYLKGNGTLYNI